MAQKRRLPVLQTKENDNAGPERSRWQWVFFGAVAMVSVWLPLAAIGQALSSKYERALWGPVETHDRHANPHAPRPCRARLTAPENRKKR